MKFATNNTAKGSKPLSLSSKQVEAGFRGHYAHTEDASKVSYGYQASNAFGTTAGPPNFEEKLVG